MWREQWRARSPAQRRAMLIIAVASIVSGLCKLLSADLTQPQRTEHPAQTIIQENGFHAGDNVIGEKVVIEEPRQAGAGR